MFGNAISYTHTLDVSIENSASSSREKSRILDIIPMDMLYIAVDLNNVQHQTLLTVVFYLINPDTPRCVIRHETKMKI